MGSRQECLVLLSALRKSYILIMARTLLILSLVSVVLTQDRYWGSYTASYPAGGGGDSGNVALARQEQEVGWNPRQDTERGRSTGVSQTKSSLDTSLYSSAASESVEPGQYVHNPDWDLTPYQIWKRKQAAKAGTTQISANTVAAAPVEKKVVTVRRPKPQPQPAVYQQPKPQQQQPRFDNFQAVQQPARQHLYNSRGQHLSSSHSSPDPSHSRCSLHTRGNSLPIPGLNTRLTQISIYTRPTTMHRGLTHTQLPHIKPRLRERVTATRLNTDQQHTSVTT